jgi:hypothetical protein
VENTRTAPTLETESIVVVVVVVVVVVIIIIIIIIIIISRTWENRRAAGS